MELKKQSKKSLIILIAFWILVGVTSTIIYDLEWFIQKVVLFNGWLSNDIAKNSTINIAGIKPFNFNSLGITQIQDFYQILTDKNETNQVFKIVSQYYDHNINQAFKIEGMLFAAAGLGASFISGPLLVFAITKRQKYKIFVLPILLALAIFMFFVMPAISTLILLIAVFTPVFAFLYSYRTALDPWATSIARKTNVKIAFVRNFYAIGGTLGSICITQMLFKLNSYQDTLTWKTAYPYYFVGGFIILLAVFLAFFMPDNAFSESHVKQEDISEKKFKEVKESNELDKQITLKQVIKNKNFIVGLIVFLILIGAVQAFNSIWINTVENLTSSTKEVNAPNQLGFQKAFALGPQLLLTFLILKIVSKISLRKFLILTSILSSISFFLIGVVVYIVKPAHVTINSLIGGIGYAVTGTLAVALGYEFVSRVTTPHTRPATFVVFNSLTYGFGGIIFVFINSFLSRVTFFGIDKTNGMWVWIICGSAMLLTVFILIFAFKEPKFITREIDDHTFDQNKQRKLSNFSKKSNK
ncbi:hypothetical protein [Mycoplasma yeatsii]|uniref:hypothetical protein n=1 Tax=Mycoplasma yeatsii TaxID=51365 RepID=UPI0005B24222|nr:hypothetical protein [Mycoplasma yeatsii]AJM71532.1 membrane protein [Mycoplasma yeatsii GM274B]